MKTTPIGALFGAALTIQVHAAPGCPGEAACWVAKPGVAAPASSAYFVQARIRPLGGAGQSFVAARYVDERNWLGAGIEVKPGSPKVNLVIARMDDGKLSRLKEWGKESLPEGAFYTVRLAVAGNSLALYLNGERLTSIVEPLAAGGQIGQASLGAPFDVADLRVGALDAEPGRIALARVNNRIALQAGDAPQRFRVNADGGRAQALDVVSTDPAVAFASYDGEALVVTPLQPGRTTIGVMSGKDRSVAAWLGVEVGPTFAPGARTYPAQGRLLPAAGTRDAPVDSLLRIRFDRAPALGASGSVRIFRASDNALVDTIHVGDELDTMGARRQAYKRVVRRKLITLDGQKATIRPHSGSLTYGVDYYVQVDDGVFKDAALGGAAFTGIGARQAWTFRTRAAMPQAATLTVDDGGRADFQTVQGALDHAASRLPRAAPVTIQVANGRYDELLYLNGKDNVTLRGESRIGVVIGSFNDDGVNPGSGAGQSVIGPGANGGRAVFLVEDADLLTLDRLTLVNTARRLGSLGAQAEALNFNSQARLVATNANFFSEQDTIQVKGYSWFYRTLIAGNVDFIWGGNRAALFEESEIRTLGDSANPHSGGYIVQARTLGANDPGFVFLNSRLTHGPGPAGNDVPPGSTYLARPGTPQSYDKVTYINCRMDAHIAPGGWSLPRSAHAAAGAGWGEYGSMDMNGAPLDLAARRGARALTSAPYANRAQVFAGFNGAQGWNPAPQEQSLPDIQSTSARQP